MLPVTVIGGGPAGAICAMRLARRGVRVALFEKRGRRAGRPAETCTPRVRMAIEAACGETIPIGAAIPLDAFRSAWGSSEFVSTPFRFWHGGSALVVARPAFDAWLLDIAEGAGVEVYRDH